MIDYHQELLTEFLFDSLCTESHQISVKFFVQWLLIRLLYKNESCLEMIKMRVNTADKTQPSTIIAFIPILYHISLLKRDEHFWSYVFELMLIWTMGPHFNLRLHAQVYILTYHEYFKKIILWVNYKYCQVFHNL